MSEDIASIRRAVRDIPDFPKPGIVFRDITPLLGNGALFGKTIDILAERYRDQKIDTVLGIESRGFIIGAALAYKLGAGFSVVRKPGKLPYETHSASYELGIRHGQIRDPYRRDSGACPRRDRRRFNRYRWNRRGHGRVGDQVGWHGCRMRICNRTVISKRPRETQAARGLFRAPV